MKRDFFTNCACMVTKVGKTLLINNFNPTKILTTLC